jgi:AbrB family looped-hinge helix DNA binding protein
MNASVSLDKAGRIILPKPIRDELNLSPGDILQVETSGAEIKLHPVRTSSPLQKEHGIWVYRTGEKLPASVVEDTIRQVREERYRAALGLDR